MNRARKTAAQLVLESVPNARAMLETGFTTVRDVGAYRALIDIALRDAINRGDIAGPRIEASYFGLRVEAHAHSPTSIKNAIHAGVASVEHATMIDDEGIALAKQQGTYFDMDIYDEECIQEQGRTGRSRKIFWNTMPG